MAWMGTQSDLEKILDDEGAEKDEQGQFLVSQPDDGKDRRVVSFLGMSGPEAEVVIPDGLCFRKDGEWYEIVPRATKSGVGFGGFKVF